MTLYFEDWSVSYGSPYLIEPDSAPDDEPAELVEDGRRRAVLIDKIEKKQRFILDHQNAHVRCGLHAASCTRARTCSTNWE